MAPNLRFRPPAFRCSICEDDFLGFLPINVAGYKTCKDCFDSGIRPQFEAALLNEESYPPKVGSTKLNIQRYADLFSTDFVSRYCKKAKEFDIPPKLRVYCADCGLFLRKATEQRRTSTCESCLSKTCLRCRVLVVPARFGTSLVSNSHPPCRSFASIDDLHMLPESTRGKDWQICPGKDCGTLVTLQYGCNHVICGVSSCRQEFCYACGRPTWQFSRHWEGSRPCPLYGHPEDRPRYRAPVPDFWTFVQDQLDMGVMWWFWQILVSGTLTIAIVMMLNSYFPNWSKPPKAETPALV